jgi:peptidoglycan/LPS O-acetylase OafA/YrhL
MNVTTDLKARFTKGYFGPTFETSLRFHGGIGPGFDFLRLALATGVILTHSIQKTGASYLYEHPLFKLNNIILPAFFALSGFLVMGSFLRLNNLRTFMTFRGLRILPALSVEVVGCALVLGPLVTQLALTDYFRDVRFWHYFTNIVGLVQYKLPGVFTTLTDDTVNGSLWTVPAELACYVSLASLALIGLLDSPRRLLISVVCGLVALNVAYFLARGQFGSVFTDYKLLVPCFYAGALLFCYRQFIPMSWVLFAACICFVCIGIYRSPLLLSTAGPFLAAYIICFLGLQKIPRIPFLMTGDFSYGLYLYAFPIQQLLIYLGIATAWYVNFALAVPLTLLFAVFSWHMIEKPILNTRHRFVGRKV